MNRIWLAIGTVVALGAAYGLARGTLSPTQIQPAGHISKTLTVLPSAATAAHLTVVVSPAEPVALRGATDLLRQGRDWLRTVPDYSAVFHKQERVHGELRERETIQLKVRHLPFSVAMAWEGNGRQAYYRQGANENRMAVRMGGWKGRLGWINLELYSTLAMQYARYPITDVGVLKLTEQLLERFEPYQDRTDGVKFAWLPKEVIGSRECRVFEVEYASPAVNPDYSRSVVWLDQEWLAPLAVENFDWDVSDPANPEGLVEYYVYEHIRLRPGLSDLDFTHDARPNPAASEVVESD